MTRLLLATLVLCSVLAPAPVTAQTTTNQWALRVTAFAGLPIVGARAALQMPNGWYAFADASEWYRGWGPCAAVEPSTCDGDGPMRMAGAGRNLRAFFVEAMAGAYHYSGSSWHPPVFYGVPPETSVSAPAPACAATSGAASAPRSDSGSSSRSATMSTAPNSAAATP